MTAQRTWSIGSLDRSDDEKQPHRKRVRRTVLLSFRITEAESHLLAEAAELTDQSVTEIIRARVFGPLPPLNGLERYEDD